MNSKQSGTLALFAHGVGKKMTYRHRGQQRIDPMDATIFGGKWKKVRQLPSGGQADTYLVTLETEREPEGVLKQANRPSSKAKDRMLCEVANL